MGRANIAVTFGAGGTSQQVTVTIKDDATAESSETFGAIVQHFTSDPVTVFLAKNTFTITDNEVVPSDDLPSSNSTTGMIAVNGTRTGTIETSGDTDWVAVALTAGRTYQFDLAGSATGDGTLGDPYLSLRNPGTGATKLVEDDDSGPGLNARFTYTAATGGTYFVVIRPQ